MASGEVIVELVVVVVVTGAGLIVNVIAPDVPPNLPGVKTEILAVPALPTSELEIVAVSLELLTEAVGWLDPFQRTIELLEKFDPFTVSVTPTRAVVLVGEMELITGRFFCALAITGIKKRVRNDEISNLRFVLDIGPPMHL